LLAADVDSADDAVVPAAAAADEKTFRFDVDGVHEEQEGEGEDATTRLLADELAAQQRRADAARAALVQHMTQRQQQQRQQGLHMHRADDERQREQHLAAPISPQRSPAPSMPKPAPVAPAWAAEFSPPPPRGGSLRASSVRALAGAAAAATTSAASLASPPRQGAVPTPTAWEPPASPTQQQQQSESEAREEEHHQEGEEGDEYGCNQEGFLPRPSPSPLAAVYAYENGPLQPHDSQSRREKKAREEEETDRHDVAETVALLAPAAARVLAELSPPNVIAPSGA
jgi:hypothetical protein